MSEAFFISKTIFCQNQHSLQIFFFHSCSYEVFLVTVSVTGMLILVSFFLNLEVVSRTEKLHAWKLSGIHKLMPEDYSGRLQACCQGEVLFMMMRRGT